MKYFLLTVVIICCFLIGFKLRSYFQNRKIFFEKLTSFCQKLKTKISFQNEKMNLIIEQEIYSCNSKDFQTFLNIFKEYLQQEISKEELRKKLDKNLLFLKSEEIDTIYSLLINLGGYYQDEELEQISNFEEWLNGVLNDIMSFNKKFLNVYFKLFIILGVMIFIIFI